MREPNFPQAPRAIVAESAARPEMPTQAQELRAAFRAKVWLIHNQVFSTRSVKDTGSDLAIPLMFPRLLCFSQLRKQLQRHRARPKMAVEFKQIVGTVVRLPEGAAANSQYRLIAKTLACRDTQ